MRTPSSDQVAQSPEGIGNAIRDLVEEYDARTTAEAIIARDADKLECLIQVREYEEPARQCPRVDRHLVAALRTRNAKKLAEVPADVTERVVASVR